MIVRLRFKTRSRSKPPALARAVRASEPPVLVRKHPVAQALTATSALAMALTIWKLGVDLQVTNRFIFGTGILAHWQSWFALAASLRATALIFSRRQQSSA